MHKGERKSIHGNAGTEAISPTPVPARDLTHLSSAIPAAVASMAAATGNTRKAIIVTVVADFVVVVSEEGKPEIKVKR